MAIAAPRPEPSKELDEVTLRRAQRGDEGACRDLVMHYQRLVFSFLSRTLSSSRAHQVEDVAQEVFLDVFRGLSRYRLDGAAKLSTWILTIASRRAIDLLRKAEPGHAIPLDDNLPTDEPADARASQALLAALVERELAALTPELRVALVLRVIHQLEYREIAELLALDMGTVKSRLSRARARLAERLSKEVLR